MSARACGGLPVPRRGSRTGRSTDWFGKEEDAMQQPGFLDDLRRMSARVGANILLVQGAGGNSSVKRDDVLWVKASGAWLSEAKEKNMFVPVELAGARAALA